MRKKLLITVLIFVSSGFVFAQTDSTLSLNIQNAQEYAINNNLELKNALLDIKIAKKKIWETTAIGLPQINGEINYQHIPGTLPTANFGSDSSTMMMYDYIFESLDKLDVNNILDEMPKMAKAEPFTLGVKNSATYSLRVSQLVFSGEYIIGLQASKTYKLIADLDYEKLLINTKANVLNSYISILILENNLNIVKASLKNMELLVSETKKLHEQGFLESTDVDQLQISLNNLINSRNTIQRQIDISYMLFKILLGTDLETKIVLTQDLDSIYDSFIEKTINNSFDLNNNVSYKMGKNQVYVTELLLKREKTKYLPNISAFYNYQDKTNKANFDFTINHIVGVSLNMPIFSSFKRNSVVQQAKIEYEKSLNNQNLLEQNLKIKEQQLRFSYWNALEKYKVTTKNVDLSKNVFHNTLQKYKQGMVSSMELTQTNNSYLQSETENINALFELFQTKIELEKILNEL
ncbi:MAG: TolC family protein [Bacteroidales bacterium]|nr:TolC family protein [Bacteroidales bacterium]